MGLTLDNKRLNKSLNKFKIDPSKDAGYLLNPSFLFLFLQKDKSKINLDFSNHIKTLLPSNI